MNLHGAPDVVRRAPLAECAKAARHLLREREARYPALVEAGKLDAAVAERGLSLARALVAQWEWIVDPANPPLPDSDGDDFGHWNFELAADIAAAARKAVQIAGRSPDDERAATVAALYAALAWWQEERRPSGVSRVVMATSVERPRAVHAATQRAA